MCLVRKNNRRDALPLLIHSDLNNYFSLLESITFHTQADRAPPAIGATMKIQRLLNAVPPWNSAGPIERAGFTEVPV